MALADKILDKYEQALDTALKNKYRFERQHDLIRKLEAKVLALEQNISLLKGEIVVL
jgi:hypothetical protein